MLGAVLETVAQEMAQTVGELVRVPPTGAPLSLIERQAYQQAMALAKGQQNVAAGLLSVSPRVMSYTLRTKYPDLLRTY